jgi:hypothetical protein
MTREMRRIAASARCDVELLAHRARQARGTRSVRIISIARALRMPWLGDGGVVGTVE